MGVGRQQMKYFPHIFIAVLIPIMLFVLYTSPVVIP